MKFSGSGRIRDIKINVYWEHNYNQKWLERYLQIWKKGVQLTNVISSGVIFSESKINESRYIVLFVVRGSIKMVFSITSIFSFSRYFLQYILPSGKVWGYLTLLVTGFINIFRFFSILHSCKNYC